MIGTEFAAHAPEGPGDSAEKRKDDAKLLHVFARFLGGCPRISTSDPLSCGYACGSYIQMAHILDIISLCQARVASQEV